MIYPRNNMQRCSPYLVRRQHPVHFHLYPYTGHAASTHPYEMAKLPSITSIVQFLTAESPVSPVSASIRLKNTQYRRYEAAKYSTQYDQCPTTVSGCTTRSITSTRPYQVDTHPGRGEIFFSLTPRRELLCRTNTHPKKAPTSDRPPRTYCTPALRICMLGNDLVASSGKVLLQ